jgi:hypothetical protein
MKHTVRSALAPAVLGCLLAALAPGAAGHGGVVREDDLCVIKVGYLEAHFKIFLPRSRGHREYCEDLPEAGETVFVMEYLHEGLAQSPVDFRIVRNDTGLGRFTRSEDLTDLDLERLTVFHQDAEVDPDVFTAVHTFDVPGEYIGIVTTWPASVDGAYTAVFPFRVGFTGVGHWPWFAAFVLFLLGNLWLARGRLSQ